MLRRRCRRVCRRRLKRQDLQYMAIQVIGFLVGYPKIDFPHSVITGNSLSEALIFASTNPQHDDRLFIELQVQYMKILSSNLERTCCVQKLILTSEQF